MWAEPAGCVRVRECDKNKMWAAAVAPHNERLH